MTTMVVDDVLFRWSVCRQSEGRRLSMAALRKLLMRKFYAHQINRHLELSHTRGGTKHGAGELMSITADEMLTPARH